MLIKSAIFYFFHICQEILNLWAKELPTRYFKPKSNNFWANAALLKTGKKKFFASTLLSIKSAIFKIFPIRQKYWILWAKPVLTPCFALKSDDFYKMPFFGGFSVFGPKRAPEKKIQQKRLAIPYEFWLPFIWIQPFVSRTPTHMRKGGVLSLYTVFRP